MNRLLICLVGATLWFGCQSNVSELKEAEQILRAVSGQFAPDSREDLLEIRFRKDGPTLIVSGETTSPEGKKALLSELGKSNKNLIDSIAVLPAAALGEKTWGLVNVSVCNIRTGPGHNAEMSTQAILGTPVRILKKSGSWLLVQTPDHYIGWVDDDALSLHDSIGQAAWQASNRIIYLPLSGAGFDQETNAAVTDLVAGSILKTAGITGSGAIAEMPDGRKIKLQANEYVDFDSWKTNTVPTADALIGCAKTLTGRPYLWGGTSSKGVDCSGFVKTVFFLNSIILARDASLQFRHGTFTDPGKGYTSLQPGDLVFFGRKADGDKPARATHVGLYMGNGEYINSSGYVRTDSFDPSMKNFSQDRADRWLGGRTILGSEGTRGIVRVKDHPWY